MQQLYPVAREVSPEEVYADLAFSPRGDRPFVAINMVSSVDGKTTIDGELRKEPIGSRIDRALMNFVRLPVDMVLRGAESVRVNPVYTGVPAGMEAARRERGLAEQPLAAIVTGTCHLPWEAPLFTAAPRRPVVFTTRQGAHRANAAVADVCVAGDVAVDPRRVLHLAREQYGVERLLLEGGPSLNYEFLEAGCVDEIFWTVAPRLIGRRDERNLVDGPRVLRQGDRLQLLSAFVHEDELFLRYRVRPAA